MKLNAVERDVNKASKRWGKETWLFPKERILGVNGFYGNDKIFIVGPSPGMVPLGVDRQYLNPFCLFLYYYLKKYKYSNAHITDLIKIGGNYREFWGKNGIDNSTLAENIKIFIDEISIIRPKHIIFCSLWFRNFFKKNKKFKEVCRLVKEKYNIDINFKSKPKLIEIRSQKDKVKCLSVQYSIISHFSRTHILNTAKVFIRELRKNLP